MMISKEREALIQSIKERESFVRKESMEIGPNLAKLQKENAEAIERAANAAAHGYPEKAAEIQRTMLENKEAIEAFYAQIEALAAEEKAIRADKIKVLEDWKLIIENEKKSYQTAIDEAIKLKEKTLTIIKKANKHRAIAYQTARQIEKYQTDLKTDLPVFYTSDPDPLHSVLSKVNINANEIK